MFKAHDLMLVFLSRSRTPQPPAEDEEENVDDSMVTIDTCKLYLLGAQKTKPLLWLFVLSFKWCQDAV